MLVFKLFIVSPCWVLSDYFQVELEKIENLSNQKRRVKKYIKVRTDVCTARTVMMIDVVMKMLMVMMVIIMIMIVAVMMIIIDDDVYYNTC
jgi:hypothetical protein